MLLWAEHVDRCSYRENAEMHSAALTGQLYIVQTADPESGLADKNYADGISRRVFIRDTKLYTS